MFTFLTFVALLLVGAGPGGAYLGLFHPALGAGLSGVGVLLLALFFFVSLVQFLRFGAGGTNWLAFFFGFAAIGGLGALGYFGFLHPINDITSDIKNPPAFVHPAYPFHVEKGAQYLDRNLVLDRSYAPANAATQAQAYPGFEGLEAKAAPADVYAGLLAMVKQELPTWRVVLDDPKTLHAEFEVESLVFRFVDDVAVEVRGDSHHPFEARVEMRSRSRVGKSDLGANVNRLRDFKVRAALAVRRIEERSEAQRSAWDKAMVEATKPAAPPPAAPATPAPAASTPAVSAPAKPAPGTPPKPTPAPPPPATHAAPAPGGKK